MRNKIGVYGGTGYLGTLVTENLANTVPISRSKLERFSIILDLSFPNSHTTKKCVRNYLELIERRSIFCNENGIQYFYAGSYSSIAPVTSKYGEIKGKAEKLVLKNGGSVLKYGLIVNFSQPGGRHKQLINRIENWHLIPIPDERYFKINATKEQDFLKSILILEKLKAGCEYFLNKTFETSLSQIVRNSLPDRKHLNLGITLSCIIKLGVQLLPARKIDPLKSIAKHKKVPVATNLIILEDRGSF
jgi:hypothetical protein